jgi:hypothetical protein
MHAIDAAQLSVPPESWPEMSSSGPCQETNHMSTIHEPEPWFRRCGICVLPKMGAWWRATGRVMRAGNEARYVPVCTTMTATYVTESEPYQSPSGYFSIWFHNVPFIVRKQTVIVYLSNKRLEKYMCRYGIVTAKKWSLFIYAF